LQKQNTLNESFNNINSSLKLQNISHRTYDKELNFVYKMDLKIIANTCRDSWMNEMSTPCLCNWI